MWDGTLFCMRGRSFDDQRQPSEANKQRRATRDGWFSNTRITTCVKDATYFDTTYHHSVLRLKTETPYLSHGILDCDDYVTLDG